MIDDEVIDLIFEISREFVVQSTKQIESQVNQKKMRAKCFFKTNYFSKLQYVRTGTVLVL
jgi:hypothetical protein